MTMFVHLTPESNLPRICRSGIRRPRKARGELPVGVFAVPVTRNFFVSHQWLRELGRHQSRPIAAVYFRVPDDEPVWVGHYRQVGQLMSAADAMREFMTAEDRLGWEVVVPRSIAAREIHRTRRVPQVLGWRYWPGANGKPPFCTCRFCTRGEYGAAKLRKRLGSTD
jgi:hypothetical protein